MLNESVDVFAQLFDAFKSAAADGSLGDDAKPSFNLIEPRSIGGSKVDVVTWTGRNPAFDLGVLVSAVIVDDKMDV